MFGDYGSGVVEDGEFFGDEVFGVEGYEFDGWAGIGVSVGAVGGCCDVFGSEAGVEGGVVAAEAFEGFSLAGADEEDGDGYYEENGEANGNANCCWL